MGRRKAPGPRALRVEFVRRDHGDDEEDLIVDHDILPSSKVCRAGEVHGGEAWALRHSRGVPDPRGGREHGVRGRPRSDSIDGLRVDRHHPLRSVPRDRRALIHTPRRHLQREPEVYPLKGRSRCGKREGRRICNLRHRPCVYAAARASGRDCVASLDRRAVLPPGVGDCARRVVCPERPSVPRAQVTPRRALACDGAHLPEVVLPVVTVRSEPRSARLLTNVTLSVCSAVLPILVPPRASA
mmetsp:Transcript_21468/g.52095  ORF Transcript_21468/g.52095 Transcript_21468/m.52095 type:complete len:242 (-) Transcript_21468:836-1561(-)